MKPLFTFLAGMVAGRGGANFVWVVERTNVNAAPMAAFTHIHHDKFSLYILVMNLENLSRGIIYRYT